MAHVYALLATKNTKKEEKKGRNKRVHEQCIRDVEHDASLPSCPSTILVE